MFWSWGRTVWCCSRGSLQTPSNRYVRTRIHVPCTLGSIHSGVPMPYVLTHSSLIKHPLLPTSVHSVWEERRSRSTAVSNRTGRSSVPRNRRTTVSSPRARTAAVSSPAVSALTKKKIYFFVSWGGVGGATSDQSFECFLQGRWEGTEFAM